MIKAEQFISALEKRGYTHCSGVPCSLLKPFINRVIDDERIDYVAASSEGEAVGINIGAHLAGQKTVTICQNSGFGNMVNPLTSLCEPFRIPTLLIITWRGKPGSGDEPQHTFMGKILPDLLDTLEIPWRSFPAEVSEIEKTLEEADGWMSKNKRPFALLMSRGDVDSYQLKNNFRPLPQETEKKGKIKRSGEYELDRRRAIEIIHESLPGDHAFIGSTGKIGRQLYAREDRENNLYVVGGMGIASAIGCGLALNRPRLPVVVLDGDGAILMKMGNLATIGAYQPRNLLHIILDNECHDSTGGQKTVSEIVNFTGAAAACNYRCTYYADSEKSLRGALKDRSLKEGPVLIHLKIKPGSPPDLPRPHLTPEEVKKRFMKFVKD
ncbi:MAG: phosphonopyruvate decarboxylase [bacterium]